MNDDEIQILEKVSAGLLGMTMDPRIPRDSKEFLTKKSTEIDGILAGLHEESSGAPGAGPDQECIAAAVLAEIRESLAPPSMPSAQLSAFADRVAARAMAGSRGPHGDTLKSLLQEIEVPGVLVDGEVRVNHDLKERIKKELEK